MDEMIRQRCLRVAEYMVRHQATVRQAARVFGMSKSSVHKDVGERLRHIHHGLWVQVSQVLEHNKAVRHLRGGDATRLRYQQKRGKQALQTPRDAIY